jgi:hypothetical protein
LNKKLSGVFLIVFMVIGAVAIYNHYLESYYLVDRGKAFLSRAETAPTPDQMADALQRAEDLLPKSGNPVWWFPTPRTDFALINQDTNGLIELARLIGTLSKEQEAYQVGMDTLRGKIRTLGEQLGEAAGYYFLSPSSVLFGFLWILGVATLLYLRSRDKLELREEEEPLLTA